jgi:hypothetical protein
MLLVEHHTNLWSVEHEFGWQAGLVTIPVRMTVIRLGDGRLVLHSPVPITGQLRIELDALGTVGFIIVPRAHGRFVEQAARAFPEAQVMVAPSAALKRRSLRSLRGETPLANHPPAAWAGEIECLLLQGFRLGEVVLFHPSSRTLVLTDLCFNIQRSSSRVSRVFFRVNGMWRHFGPSRLIRRLAVSDRAALGESLGRVLEWDFDRILPGHGDPIEADAPAALRRAWPGV